ncbi:MAG: hypothetical protein IPN36_14490 [Bacteroidetes bacterium]|nr:hypothetical protein [Bacteroidota bacterium]MBL0095246.1 hypothetical protein [Bacteroidota bacterium]
MSVDSVGRIAMAINGTSYFSTIVIGPGLSVNTIFDGRCHHIAVKRSLNDLSFFLDGNFISSSVINGNPSLSTNYFLRVGTDNNLSTASALQGKIEYIRVWNLARKNADILIDMHRCLSSVTGLVTTWSFEQTPGNVILDSSPFLHHGLIIPQHGNPVNYGPRFGPSICQMEECDLIAIEPASDPNCNTPSTFPYCSNTNLICNGDFEQENSPAGSFPNFAFDGCTPQGSSNEVVNWCMVAGTPSYYARNPFNINYGIPNNFITQNFTPFCVGGIDTWNNPTIVNDHYSVLAYSQGNVDGIRTELISPLVPHTTYTLQFRSLCVSNNQFPFPVNPTPLKFELWDTPNAGSGIPLNTITINNGCNWNLYRFSFVAPANANLFSHLVVKVEGAQNGNSIYYFFVDDFELYPNTSAYPRWMSGLGSQRPCEITTDLVDNVYFVGYADHEITYPDGTVQGTPNTGSGFIASYDPCGNVRWANNSNTPTVIYRAVSFDNIANPTRLLVAGQTTTGITIETYDPSSGTLLTSVPVPGSNTGDEIITSKTDAGGLNWYILYQENGTGFYYFIRYNITFNTVFGPNLIPGIQNLNDFSINSLITGNVNRVFLLSNSNVNSSILDYNIATGIPLNTNTFQPANGNQTEVLKFTTIDQNNAGILCVGGFYADCDVTYNANIIVPNVPQGVAGLWSNAFTFLFNPATSSVITGSGRYIGGNGDSRTTKIVADPNGDFIATGIVNTSNINVPVNTNFSSGWIPNLNSRGLFITKINSITGIDQWLKQGISTFIGTWQKDIVCGNNGVIYGLGYLNGTLDFLQGDTWSSTSQCDNTYVLKIQETGNNAVIERMNGPNKPSSVKNTPKTLGYFLPEAPDLNDLLNRHNFSSGQIVDFSGRIIIDFENNSVAGKYWDKLNSGCFYLRLHEKLTVSTFLICK